MAEEIHSRKLGVIVGGSNWITLPSVSRRGMTKRSCTMDTHFPDLTGIGGAEAVEILSGEG